ncbi:lipase family protein [Paraburkholderia antibiotica]|uniref:Lipase family protein n=1 Tax=Paraburkholderia antibiotica TaxID=2728839 RepID=A0A7Y0FGF6_9BURK|nr:lipase family protein [Paraburkholderia antibiotica]NML34970.1 lipase family protein [Paraburkholderia antibiotica]
MQARDFALIAQEAYVAKPDIGKADSASRAIVRHTDAGLVVAFPGSDNDACWATDFDVLTINVPDAGEIHRGFWAAWMAIADDVVKAIGNQPVTLVGHSLGGALAICCAVALTLAGKPPVAVYGFEAPRVSPGLGVRTLLAKVPVYIYKCGSDPVPDVPLGWHQSALVTHIGPPATIIPRVADHMIERVIDAFGSGVPA